MQRNTDGRVHAFGAVVLVACALFGAGAVRATDEPTTEKSTTKSTTTTTAKPATVVATTTTTTKTSSPPRNTRLPVMFVPPEQRKPVTATTVKATSASTTTTATKSTAVGRPVMVVESKDYGVTVSAQRVAGKRAPASAAATPVAKSVPSSAERMSKSSAARPVVTSGPKAAATPTTTPTPTKTTKTTKPVASPAKQTLAASEAVQPGWSFRNTQVGGASTTKVVASTVAGGPAAATKPVARSVTATVVAAKPAAPAVKPTTMAANPAKTAPAVVKSTTVATNPPTPAVKPAALAAKPMPGVQVAGSSTASAKPAAKPMAKTTTSTVTRVAVASAVATVAAAPAKETAKSAAAPTKVAAKTGKKRAPLMPAVQTLGAAFMERREMYVYNSLERRDPFESLVSGSFEGTAGTPLLDVSSMKLVGIVWGGADKFALVEDSHGHGFVLRVGDPVLNGYVAGLTKEELIVKQSSYGDTQTVTIQLQRKDGVSNAN